MQTSIIEGCYLMKFGHKFLGTALLLPILLGACTGAPFQDTHPGSGETFPSQFITGEVYVLKSGQTVEGDVTGVGTTLIIEENAVVRGDVSLVGSSLDISGSILGDVNVFAGTSVIRDTAKINGSINQIFHQIEIEPNAVVSGEINEFVLPAKPGADFGEGFANFLDWLRPDRILAFQIGRVILFTFIAVLVTYVLKTPTIRISSAITTNPITAWGAGIITWISAPVISFVLIITICLIPFGVLLILAFLIGMLWGWIALSFLVGEIFAVWLKLEWSEEGVAAVGALILGVLTVLISFIPCLGFFINQIIGVFGLGGVLISRFGRYV